MYNLWIVLPCGCIRNVWTKGRLLGDLCVSLPHSFSATGLVATHYH